MIHITKYFLLILLVLLSACTNFDDEIAQLSTVQAYQATQIADQATTISYLATRGPAPLQPDNPTVTPYRPVEGAVIIEEGRCYRGGIAGESINIDVSFEAYSPMASVTEMRVLTGGIQLNESDMAAAEWEPMIASKRLPVHVALNWISYHVSVQYRDAQGNLSPVFYDDISIEGHPASPTP